MCLISVIFLTCSLTCSPSSFSFTPCCCALLDHSPSSLLLSPPVHDVLHICTVHHQPPPSEFLFSSNSSALSSCHSRVYQSLANLIRWADQVMLDGIDLDDKENVASVTNVIKAVLDGVKVWALCWKWCGSVLKWSFQRRLRLAALSVCEQELVKLTIEKQEQPSPTTPNKPAAPAVTAERWAQSTLAGLRRFRRSEHVPSLNLLFFFTYAAACQQRCPW